MSAIWGVIDFAKKGVQSADNEAMQQAFLGCKIDSYNSIVKDNVVMGCGLQAIKSWSVNETLPLFDEQSGIVFTFDGVLDNRAELMAELGITDKAIPDGTLLFAAYKKWGAMMAKRIYGSYCYALYNQNSNELFMAGDHVATRSLFYKRVGSRLFFSNRIESILALNKDTEINEEWLALFIGLTTLTIHTNPVDTVYKDIYRIEALHHYRFYETGVEKVKYWDFDDLTPLNLGSDDEYKKMFREIYNTCATQTVQGVIGEPAIMLSGGFDSTTVAALVATELAKQGKNLHGYTHVPIDSFSNKNKMRGYIPDETNTTLEFCKMYANIKPNFLQTPEADGFSNIETILKSYESPYKSLTNIDWILAMYKKAGEDGRKILLNGQSGNGSVSYGRTNEYISYKMHYLDFFTAFKTANNFCKKCGYSRKMYFKAMLKNRFSKTQKSTDYLKNTLLNKDYAASMGILPNDERLLSNEGIGFLEYKEQRRLAINPIAFAHIADAETGMSLANGIIIRDPTRDIRLLEFCSRIPYECYVNSRAESRRLVRHYCDDLIPKSFLPESAPRGMQSSDSSDRLLPNWDSIYPKIVQMLARDDVKKFYDAEKLEKLVAKLKNIESDDVTEQEVRQLGVAYLIGIFIEKHNNRKNNV